MQSRRKFSNVNVSTSTKITHPEVPGIGSSRFNNEYKKFIGGTPREWATEST
jgi:hypothetical protein